MPTASKVFERYAVHWVAFGPARGSELRKTRAAVNVSLDPLNRALETVVVCPLTGQLHPGWRTRLQVKAGGKKLEVAADQIRVVSKDRLGGGGWAFFRRAMLRLCGDYLAKCTATVEGPHGAFSLRRKALRVLRLCKNFWRLEKSRPQNALSSSTPVRGSSTWIVTSGKSRDKWT